MTTQVTPATTANASCIFCQIVRKEAPASIIYEDDTVLAFLDIRPLNEGHTLVIPKQHYENVYDIPEELNIHVHKTVKRLAVVVKKVTKAEGITIIQQNESAAGQEVFHLHVHVVPRYEGQKLPHFSDIPKASREQLEQAAERIRLQLKTWKHKNSSRLARAAWQASYSYHQAGCDVENRQPHDCPRED